MTPFAVRAAELDDVAYVARTWLDSYEGATDNARARRGDYLTRVNRVLGGICKDAYFRAQHSRIDELAQRCRVVVVVLEAEPTIIAGWACAELHSSGVPVLHYIYTRARYRGLGIAAMLLTELGVTADAARPVVCTHLTAEARAYMARHHGCYEYVPVEAFTGRAGRKSQ